MVWPQPPEPSSGPSRRIPCEVGKKTPGTVEPYCLGQRTEQVGVRGGMELAPACPCPTAPGRPRTGLQAEGWDGRDPLAVPTSRPAAH